jgi:phosphate transport system substrate-binding protein
MKFASIASAAALGAAMTLPATGELTGSVEVAGSSTVYPISTFVAELFTEENPEVSVNIKKIGSGGGFEQFTKGKTDASNASRLIKAKEIEEAKSNGVEFIEMLVAYDGLSVVIHPNNDWAEELTLDQLKTIFDGSSSAKTWKDVDASFPDVPLKIYVPSETSGTFDYFKDEVIGDDGEIRGEPVGENDNLTVRGVSQNEGGIGFLGYAFYAENKDKINSVAIENKAGEFVKPTNESIESGDYNPLSRPLFVYWNVDSLARPEVAALANFHVDVAGDASEEVGYVRLPSWVYESMNERLQSKTTGSIYYDEDLNPVKGTLKELLGGE